MAGRTEAEIVAGLLDICRDAGRGFRVAADCVADPELKRVFTDAARRRDVFATELLPFAHAETSTGTAGGALHRRWMLLKDALTNHNEASILDEAIRGESIAVDVYTDAIGSMLPPRARPIVQRHLDEIRELLDDLKLLALPCI